MSENLTQIKEFFKNHGRKVYRKDAARRSLLYALAIVLIRRNIFMKEHKAVSLAKEIVALDIKRDELLETLMKLAGNDAFPLLRAVQNSLYRKSS